MSLPPPTVLAALWALRAVHTSRPKHPVVARAQLGLVLFAQGLEPFLWARSWLARSQAPQYTSLVKPPYIWSTQASQDCTQASQDRGTLNQASLVKTPSPARA
ncbi:hypothetical protein DFH06DRAFT_1125149 [Mycena polygramma]|nr:hypothetical protein DFH06DRAFT_1125149 [Mycena polygramma]